ncbi:MAG: hypothetical protein PHS41_09995 [Victivallaceae bacterium]|nr:hypothetical protein [Victivallaceae bacterium]
MRKYLLAIVILALTLAVILALPGCVTETTQYKFDEAGNLVEKTVSERSTGDRLADVLGRSEGSWLVVRTGWAAYISASTATTEDPTPTIKLHLGSLNFAAGKVTTGQADAGSVAKAHSDIIGAAFKDVSVSASGAGSSTPDNPPLTAQ